MAPIFSSTWDIGWPTLRQLVRILLTALITVTASAHAQVVALKGKNGRVIDFNVRDVQADGLVGIPAGTTQSISIPWTSLDLEWLATNQPGLDARRRAAIRKGDAFANSGRPTNLPRVKAVMIAALGREEDWGLPLINRKHSATAEAAKAALYGSNKKTTLLKVLAVAANRNSPAQRAVIEWLKTNARLTQTTLDAIAVAKKQTAALPPDGNSRSFLDVLHRTESALQEIASNPATDRDEWGMTLARFVAALRG